MSADDDTEEGRYAVRRERRKIRQLVGCVLCGHGELAEGSDGLCTRCQVEMDPSPAQFALRLLLEAMSMTQQEIAPLLGVSRPTLARVARGQRVSKRTAEILAPHLQVDADAIRRGREPKE